MHLKHHHEGMKLAEYVRQTGYTGPSQFWDAERRARASVQVKQQYTEALRAARSDAALSQWRDPLIRTKRIAALKVSRTSEDRTKTAKKYKPVSAAVSTLRAALYARADSKCENCGRSEAEEIAERGKKLHLHHLKNDRIIANLEEVMLLCARCHASLHGDGFKRERYDAVTKIVGQMLLGLKVDLEDENFSETPRRFTSYLLEHFKTHGEIEQELEQLKATTFPSESRDLVVVRNVEVYGICPHHLLPIFYKIDLAYVPAGRVIGLSKLARLADLCARLPLLQESMVVFLSSSMEKILGTTDVGAVVVGEHLCMRVRGPQIAGITTVTSSVSGCFKTDASARAELMSLLKKG